MPTKKNKHTVADILAGTTPGRMQSVGYMQVIPLIGEIHDDRFVSPKEAEVSTTNYGTMEFQNNSEHVLIVPTHAAYVVDQAAQNHGMAHTGLVKGKSLKKYDTAMCVQQNQGGMITKGKHQLSILPFSLRETALDKRGVTSYSKLWDDISAFNKKFGLRNAGHLEFFLQQFEKELNQFVAEFESVPQQVGAIILVDGTVVGLEKTPSNTYWLGVWEALIRECYGSLAMEYSRQMGERPNRMSRNYVPMGGNVESLDDLEDAYEEALRKEEELVKETIRTLLEHPFSLQTEESLEGLNVETARNDQFYGQVIREDGFFIYASLVSNADWMKKAKRSTASKFSI